ncbi:MAG: thiolase family protein [Pseudomonadota bacterium]
MKLNAVVAGVGMTRFAKHLDRNLKSLGAEAITKALRDAGLEASELEAAYMSNASAGAISGQEMIRGQVVLHAMGIGKIPVINVENACASASSAFSQAAAMVSAGIYDVVLACGTEKMYHADKRLTYKALGGAVDVEAAAALKAELEASAASSGAEAAAAGAGEKRSVFMDFYARAAREHMRAHGTTAEQFAAVSAKNSLHGSLNPNAQFQTHMSVDDVMAAPMIAEPLTRPMCSPVGDGAAAAILMSERKARALGLAGKAPRVVCSALSATWPKGDDEPGLTEWCATSAYELAGLGPNDLSLVELHDASALAELVAYENLGLCGAGESGPLVASGATRLGGRLPVNTSGGLLRKGHPIGATGIAQVVELTEQLRGTAGARQVEGARIGLAHNAGGSLGRDSAACCVTILTAN